MSKPKPINPRRDEVWDVILESNAGKEPRKSQPAVVMSTDALNGLTTRVVVLITSWDDRFSDLIWVVPIKPHDSNGLETNSAVDATQISAVTVNHFISRRGRLSAKLMEEITAAIAATIELK